MNEPLDNPVWHALIGAHASFATGGGKARHYARDVVPFSAIEDDSVGAYADLAAHLPSGMEARLFRPAEEELPDGWEQLDSFPMLQMVALPHKVAGTAIGPALVDLGVDSVDAMLELAKVAKPGPFWARTVLLGGYIGVVEDGRLLAMAGERMRVAGHVELSAICTHPDARGRGLGTRLTRAMMQRAFDRGERPFLHVRPENAAACSLYRQLGFETRREIRILWRRPVNAA
jgi:ribosomal protein S18 acetylase RimI-like enzyme